MTETRFFLSPAIFAENEHVLIEHGVLVATAFHYPSGVAGLRIENDRGALALLPYQGQQIWSAQFNGRELTMRSMFEQPYPTQDFLRTFGGFFQHCGLAVTPDTGAPFYGELPNAPYDQAWMIAGEDERGMFLELGGEYRHTRAFACDYVANPRIRLYAGRATFSAAMHVSNLRNAPLPALYQARANFRPVDNGWLVYSAPEGGDHLRFGDGAPDDLADDPSLHHVLGPNRAYDPGVTLYVDYKTDPDGFAHSLQIHTDGSADYVRHRPDQLPCGQRWICRAPEHDALGLVLPATAGLEQFAAGQGAGDLFTIAAGETWECEVVMGALNKEETAKVKEVIAEIKQH